MALLAELKRRNVIRVALAYLAGAWLLIQVADTIFPALGLPESSLTVLLVVIVVGFVPAVVIAWAFEMTPEGLRRDAEVRPGESIAPQTGHRIDRVIMVVLALGIGFFAIDKFVFDPGRDRVSVERAAETARKEALVGSYEKSIAVLPFTDLSPAGDQQYFSDGVAEDILNLLARLRDLRVISRSSSFAYRGEEVHVPTVAEELGVSYVLEGSLRMAGEGIRINVQLIEAPTDTTLWSQEFDKVIGDVFEIQDSIAGAIVDKLKIHLLNAQPRSRRTTPEAYELYLRANHLVRVQCCSDENYDEALQHVGRVLEMDPSYVAALTLKAMIYFAAPIEVLGVSEPESAEIADQMIDRALAIDPDDGVANGYKGWRELAYRGDVESASRHTNRALAAESQHAEVLRVTGATALMFGQFEVANDLLRRAMDRAPQCGWCDGTLFRLQWFAGDLAGARIIARSMMPAYASGNGWLTYASLLIATGEPRQALDYIDRYDVSRTSRVWAAKRAMALCQLGDPAAFENSLLTATVDDDLADSEDLVIFYSDMAVAKSCAGDTNDAFAWLDKTLGVSHAGRQGAVRQMAEVIWNPLLADLHADPRWQAFRDRAGYSPERLAKLRIHVPAGP